MKTYEPVTMFFPADPRNVDILFTTQEVFTYLRSFKLKVDPDHIDYLVKHGVVGQRDIDGRGKRKSIQGSWSLPQRELLREALTLEQRSHAKMVDLCVLPVAKWLYWGGPADVTLEQLNRAMATWAAYQRRRTRRSYERAKHGVATLVRAVSHPGAVEKRAGVEQLANFFYNWDPPDVETLQERFAPLIDPDQNGSARGPQHAPFSADVVGHILAARMTAIDAILHESISESLWEWVRAFSLLTMQNYQQQRPTWLAEVAQDKEMALLFQPSTQDQLYSASCSHLTLGLGMGLLDPAPTHVPVHWHPANWEKYHLTGQVSSLAVPSGQYGPGGYPVMNIRTTVAVDFPEALRQQ